MIPKRPSDLAGRRTRTERGDELVVMHAPWPGGMYTVVQCGQELFGGYPNLAHWTPLRNDKVVVAR